MRFNVSGKTFQTQLQAVAKVINAKNALSILDNFLIKVEGDRMSITGSDQENVLTAYMEINDSDKDGEIALSAKRLLEVIKEINNQPLTFNINDETKEVEISFLNGHFTFMGVDAAEYPLSREPEADAHTIIFPTSVVQKGIENTLFAVGTDKLRPVMTGICWDIHEGDITFVSSDTHKLVRYINRTFAPGFHANFIMPSKPASILGSIIGKDDADIKLTFDSKGAVFEIGDYLLSCLFIKGAYPNYNRVIPQDSPFKMTVDRQSFITALRRACIFAQKASNLVVLDLDASGVRISAQDPDYSTSAEEKVACDYEGNDISIGFNGQFMIEILSVLKDDTVNLALSGPTRPGVYTPLTQGEGEEILIIQMPVQML